MVELEILPDNPAKIPSSSTVPHVSPSTPNSLSPYSMYEILSTSNNTEQFLDILNENNNDIDIVNNILLKAKNILLEHINV